MESQLKYPPPLCLSGDISENNVRNEATCRYLFRCRKKEEDETFDEFLLALRTLSADCNFHKLEDSMIRHQFIYGIKNKQFRDRVLKEDLDLDECLYLYKSLEEQKLMKDEENSELNAISSDEQTVVPSATVKSEFEGDVLISGVSGGLATAEHRRGDIKPISSRSRFSNEEEVDEVYIKSENTYDVNIDGASTSVVKTVEFFEDGAVEGDEEKDEDLMSENTDINADYVNADDMDVVKTEEFLEDGADESFRSPECRTSPPRQNVLAGVPPLSQQVSKADAGPSMALVVTKTPGGSIRPTGFEMPVVSSLGRGVNQHAVSRPLLQNSAEFLEAMDMSDEDAEDLVANYPGHIHEWVRDNVDLVTPIPSSPLLSVSTESHNENDEGRVTIPGVGSGELDVRPSGSGRTRMPQRIASEAEGSDLDSDYDDEFRVADIQNTATSRLERDIPEDDELDEPIRDQINAIQSAMDEENDRLLGVPTDYTWESDYATFRGSRETFSGPTPGPVVDYETPYDAFTDIWSEDIIELIVRETNRYAKQTIDKLKADGRLKDLSRLHKWVDTGADEIMELLAVYMFMGIDPRTSQKEFWLSGETLEMPRFKRLISYGRYILLSKFLHFTDNSDVSQNFRSSGGDLLSGKLAKLAPVISHLNQKFSSQLNLLPEICIDESLTLFKGRLSWVQAIRSKATRFGIKSFELCESRTGYLYKFDIYTGKNSESAPDAPLSADLAGKSTRAVLDLLKGLENRGHCVTMDNFYNSPALARYLKSSGFDCLGTLRTCRKNVPSDISKIPENAAKGTIIGRHCGDVSIVAWKDTKVVAVISTYHDAETYVGKKAGKLLVKPVCVKDYNSTMGGVDLKDQKLSMYLLERKRGLKWYVKMFKRLLNASIHNAFVLHAATLKRQGKPPISYREFRFDLANNLARVHASPQITSAPAVENEEMRLRRDILHVPEYVPGSAGRRNCVMCTRNSKQHKVHSRCKTCDEHLCFDPCWVEWHTTLIIKEKDRRGRKRTRND